MNKALLAVAGVAVAGGVYYFTTTGTGSQGSSDGMEISIPSLSKSELNSLVASQTESYKSSGFAMSQSGDSFVLTAEDEQKVRTFLFDKFPSMLPTSYSSTMNPLKQEFLSNKENIVAGLEFDMKVVETNGMAQLEVTLKKLPTQIQTEMETAGTEAQWFKEMLDRGAFSYLLTMNKKGEVNGITVKDINEQIKPNADANIDFKMQGIWAKFAGDINGAFKLQEGIKNISLAVQERDKNFDFAIQNVKGSMDQKTPFDQVTSSSVEKISFTAEKHSEFIEFLMQGIAFTSKTEAVNGFINSKADMASHNVHFKMTQNGVPQADVTLNGFKFALSADHISKEAALAVQELGVNADPVVANEKLQAAIAKMLKTGLTLDLTALDAKRLAVMAGPINKEVKDFSFTLNAQLKENSLDMNAGSPAQYIPFVKVTARLALNDADLTKLLELQPMLAMFTGMKKMEGELAVFNFAFVNGQMTINGNPLPF